MHFAVREGDQAVSQRSVLKTYVSMVNPEGQRTPIVKGKEQTFLET